ncbi:MAG: hypothetical protein GEV09_09725 [Pseudonocardiaceae bacterium]|nr:hypothetical protein [Pseudonocardiaceae bacterium]
MTAGPDAPQIPADAIDALCDASSGVFRRDLNTALRETAAPLIVAAELRNWADLLAFKTGLIPDREVVSSAIEQLRARAARLDPPGCPDH